MTGKANMERMKRLKVITTLLADQALVPVAKASARVRHIEEKAKGLAAHRQDLLQASHDPTVAATMLSQAERLRQHQARALQELALARVTFEQEKAKATRAVGQDLILDQLIDKQNAAFKRELERRKLR